MKDPKNNGYYQDDARKNGSEHCDPRLGEKLAREMNVPVLFSSLLCQRGIHTAHAASAFLNPKLADLPSPFLMKGMDRAASIVVRALQEKWQICIHGDYDVDGISATALLSVFFNKLGVPTICYQPDRMTEGYGLQAEFISSNSPAEGTHSLLITVDCGISAVSEVALAREKGHTVIVTDHHEPPDVLPDADALINPKQEGCSFPFNELSGVGVAFFLAGAIRSKLIESGVIVGENIPNLKQFTDLVALGTIADVVPLTGINRILVKAGLEIMSAMPSPWVTSLKRISNIHHPEITSEDISYRFAPRINAPGRLGNPAVSFELLASDDHDRAEELVKSIDAINTRRRDLVAQASELVFNLCAEQEQNDVPGFVLYGGYHPGIIGILASKVVDRYNKPIIIFTDNSVEPGQLKGSGRSVDTINLYEVLRQCTDTILQFGGHAMAAGLTLKKENLPFFTERFNFALLQQKKTQEAQEGTNNPDIDVQAEELLNNSFIDLYHRLEPFGCENPEPVFLLKSSQVKNIATVKDHLKFSLHVNGHAYRAIGFGLAHKKEILENGNFKLAVKLKKNFFRGVESTEIYTVDIK